MKLSSFIVALVAFTPSVVVVAGGIRATTNLEEEEDFRLLSSTDDAITTTPPLECFPETATVQVRNQQGPVMMKDLQLGDEILIGKNNEYQAVYAFGHREEKSTGHYLQFQTAAADAAPLEITGGHLLFVEGKSSPVRADSVRVGDVLQGENGVVTKISNIEKTGLYAPLTPAGTLVVDGIKASSYLSLQDHKQDTEKIKFKGGLYAGISQQNSVHFLVAPLRMICTSNHNMSICQSYNERGINYFVHYGMEMASWIDSQSFGFQLILMATYILVVGSFFILETILAAPKLFLLATGMYAMTKTFHANVQIRARKVKSV